MRIKGVLDRFENNDQAVILIEDKKEELIINRRKLPAGSDINTWFHLQKNGERYEVISIDQEKTKVETDQSKKLMEALKKKKKTSKFKRK